MKVQLKVIGGSKAGQFISINFPQFLIGRADDCHLKPRSDLISRYHCVIISENGYVAIRDLGSKNGVFHNGKRVVIEEELKNGDRILIGPLEFEVVLSVGLKGETKPKVESIQEVVARTVEQGSTPAGLTKKHQSDKGDETQDHLEISNWLLDAGESNDDETQGFAIGEEDPEDVLAGLQYKKEGEGEEEAAKKKEEDKTATSKAPSTPGNTSDAAANLLKNFFKGGR